MNFLHKKLWLAWSGVRFLMLPRERRARLEVSTDGRHLTFLLTALGEAGYGVHVVGSPFVFRELMCLRKSVPMPFVVGGKERECGISITDRSEKAESGNAEKLKQSVALAVNEKAEHLRDSGERMAEGGEKKKRRAGSLELGAGFAERSSLGSRRSTLFVLDYDYFSGLTTKHTNTHEREEAGLRLAGQAGAAFSNPFPSGLARDSENTAPTRFASGPAGAAKPPKADGGELMAELNSSATSYSPLVTALRAPYFMHPSVYHRGRHKKWQNDGARQRRRRFRIGFFGTHDREFYLSYYHFPGMNRFEILEVFLQKFGDRITHLQGSPRDWDPSEIAVSMDSRGGDRNGKRFLSQEHYFEALRECDFVLSPPGWCMPVSHNLIEAMFCGAIPITNGGAFMAKPLKDGETCLDFQDAEGLLSVIESALAMDERELGKMRAAVLDYYGRFLAPKAFGEALVHSESGRVLVNAEENSARLVFPGMVFPWEVSAGTVQT